MRNDEVIEMDGGPRVAKMYRLAVEYISQAEGIPMSRVYQNALDALMADYDWTHKGLRDYYGRRADDLNTSMSVMKERGIGHRRQASKERSGVRRAA